MTKFSSDSVTGMGTAKNGAKFLETKIGALEVGSTVTVETTERVIDPNGGRRRKIKEQKVAYEYTVTGMGAPFGGDLSVTPTAEFLKTQSIRNYCDVKEISREDV